ncbi:MAG TPA: Gfo/Idh/MocA family oxidoreductase [Chthonomonadales bacterium]|nr:Gfo/Idh/MocA family oxidoreductase [Chthonomonadales bacterium]
MVSELGVAVIGVGRMGQPIAQVLFHLPNARLVAVCDVEPQTVERVSKEIGVPGYTDFRQMLAEEPGIEAVCVCTSDQAHREPCVAAAQANKHIFVEKPLAVNVEDGETIVRAAHDAGVKLMVGHILRFDPRYIGAQQAVAEGRIGEPIHAFVRRNNILASGRRLQGRTSVLYFLGIHDTDFLLWCLGSLPHTVYAAASRKLLADLGVDDSIFVLMHFPGGVVACLEASWALPNSAQSSLDARVEIVGTRGAVYVDIYGQGLTVIDENRLDCPDTMYGPVVHGQVSGAVKEEIAHFVSCVLEDREPLITGEMGLDAVRVVAAAHRSLETGRPEPV